MSDPKHPKCSACRYWERLAPRATTGVCHAHPEWDAQTFSNFYCADHDPKWNIRAKETR